MASSSAPCSWRICSTGTSTPVAVTREVDISKDMGFSFFVLYNGHKKGTCLTQEIVSGNLSGPHWPTLPLPVYQTAVMLRCAQHPRVADSGCFAALSMTDKV